MSIMGTASFCRIRGLGRRSREGQDSRQLSGQSYQGHRGPGFSRTTALSHTHSAHLSRAHVCQYQQKDCWFRVAPNFLGPSLGISPILSSPCPITLLTGAAPAGDPAFHARLKNNRGVRHAHGEDIIGEGHRCLQFHQGHIGAGGHALIQGVALYPLHPGVCGMWPRLHQLPCSQQDPVQGFFRSAGGKKQRAGVRQPFRGFKGGAAGGQMEVGRTEGGVRVFPLLPDTSLLASRSSA